LTSALDGGEWSASRPGRFTPREIAPGIHWIGGGAQLKAQGQLYLYLTTPCSRVLEKLTVNQLLKKFNFLEPESSLPCSQEPAMGPYPEPNESSPHFTTVFP